MSPTHALRAFVPTLLCALGLLSPALIRPALAAGPFDIGGKPPEWAAATMSEQLALRPEPTSSMLDLIAGVLRQLDRKQIAALRASGAGGDARAEEPPPDSSRWCVLHLAAAPPGVAAPAKQVEILRSMKGEWYAREVPSPAARPGAKAATPLRLDAEKFARLAGDWPMYRGDFQPIAGLSPGKAAELPRPYSPGWITLDKATLGERFLNGQPTTIKGAHRVLADEKLLVRLPTGYTPRERCGLFVWVDAAPTAAIHQCLWPAADELRLILIGAEKTGNDIYASNRYQLALDAAQTGQERFLIDPDRVYIGGISGGGRISTQMWACFPDIFTGAVPVVGLDCYESVPAGGNMVHRAGYAKPSAARWKSLLAHRIAPMTGPPDFNFAEITKFARIYARDRIDIRVFEYPDMAHQLPTGERFAEAIRWGDAPAGQKSAVVRDAALAKLNDLPDGEKGTPQWTARRVGITAADPWSKQAWAAADELIPPKRD